MRILSVHSDFIEFEPKSKAFKAAEEAEKAKKRVEECLVIFTSVEKNDDVSIVTKYVEEIMKLADQVKPKSIVLYPWVHLSNSPSSPDVALEVLKAAEAELKSKGFDVIRAPFGWYKAFNVSCKGHPLSELSRTIEVDTEKAKTQREVISENIEKKHYILTPSGQEFKVDVKDEEGLKKILSTVGNKELETYVLFNEVKQVPSKEPPSIKEMQQQELLGYAPEADSGHFKFYPKGNLIFELLKDWAYEIAVVRLNSLQIETPIIYDWSDKEIREQGGSFHERHYTVRCPDDEKKEWVMRFAGDFGLFKIMKAATLSYRTLPVRMYEFSKSFRYEQKGELSGLKRLRAFHMPDIHSFTRNVDEGWEEYKVLFKKYDDLAKGAGIKYAIVFRIVEEFYVKNKDQIIEMLKYSNAPAFIETLSEMKHYWAVKHEFQGLDSVGGSTQLSTVQLDVKDAETYGIVYVDNDGKKKGCVIVHSSIGSIERIIYCILESSFKMSKPEWPFWLSPTQVRVVPVSEKYTGEAVKIAERMNASKIRTDVDDSNSTMQKKVAESEKEWVPYTIVLGEKELSSGKLAVRNRQTGKIENISESELIAKLLEQQTGMPWRPLALPLLLTKRPIFVG